MIKTIVLLSFTMTASVIGAQRYELVAAPGEWRIGADRVLPGFAYGGRFPGPLLEARQGIPLEIVFRNQLAEPTVVHWHGLRIPAAMDGTERSQRPVESGASFTYAFTPPDAGTFWYHPHSSESRQIERGLVGTIIVRGPSDPTVDGEQLLVFDDVKVSGQDFARFGTMAQRWNGREGSVLLINGRADAELSMNANQVERWRILNSSNARYLRLALGGRPFKIIGSDGGLIEHPVTVTEILLTPGDRVELAVGPFEEGQVINIESLPHDRGIGKGKTERYGTLRIGPPRPSVAAIPSDLRSISPLAESDAKPNRTVTFDGKISLLRAVDWKINGKSNPHDAPVKVGELQVWEIVNASKIDHPFHLHGFFFQVLSEDGVPSTRRSWEDVANVPAKSRIRIAWMPDDRPGTWMYHCHIVEHQGAGMMAHFEVVR